MTADLLMRLRGARVPTYMHVGISEALERLMREAADEIERLQDRLATQHGIVSNHIDSERRLQGLLRESAAAFDCIANRDGEQRWDLAKRIDAALSGSENEPLPDAQLQAQPVTFSKYSSLDYIKTPEDLEAYVQARIDDAVAEVRSEERE